MSVKYWIPVEQIESTAQEQINNIAKHPRLFKHVAIMPDVHAGMGVPIGSVIPLKNAIMPVGVGVDIGCGMCAVKTNAHTVNFDKLYEDIVARIPMGFTHRTEKHEIIQTELPIKKFQALYPDTPILPQLGTLGGGNHFIELQKDVDDNIWIMLHSGSRNIGNKIASRFINKAKEICDCDLAYLDADSDEGQLYLEHIAFAMDFAYQNRLSMINIIKELLYEQTQCDFDNIINIHHNYVALEHHFGENVWVHRKGATLAIGMGIIPGSMGSPSYIVWGKNCADSFNSCSHGSGRLMSRTAARGKYNRKKNEYKSDGKLNVDDFISDMKGIYTRNLDRNHLDESPRAYKPIDQTMKYQSELVDILVELKPIFNIKQ